MKLPSGKSALWPVVVCALGAVLVTLGVLQYRWSKEISAAAASRMRADLLRSMSNFRQDFLRELAGVAVALEPNYSYGTDFESYARRFANWRRAASYPGMVQDVYIWQREPAPSQFLKVKSPGEEPERVDWPAALVQFRAMMTRSLPSSRLLLPAPGLFPHESRRRPADADKVRLEFGMPLDAATGVPATRFGVVEGSVGGGGATGFESSVDVQHEAIPGDVPKLVMKFRDRAIVTLNGSPWMVIPSVPALVHPFAMPSPGAKRSRNARVGWMIIPLNQAFLVGHLFPELVARHFSGLDYEVAVVAGEKRDRAIYSSNGGVAKRSLADADASMSLFSIPGSPQPHELHFAAMAPLEGVATTKYGNVRHTFDAPEAMELLPMPGVSAPDEWHLVVNNRRGSLEAAVAVLHRRHLAIGFGVLLVLAITMGIIIRATRQAQELARLQIEFVAGVSHELRTPLTVISSAADNIADGVVKTRDQLANYGKALKGQASQLRDLVEQILLFAATRDKRQTYSLRAVQVADAVDLALQNTAELIRGAGFTLEYHVSRNLPTVSVDVQALSRCLQNLITNAIKYGGDACWIAIEGKTEAPDREVTVSVRDHGIGISQEELKHIFEPFYRGSSVRDAQIHGNGLGLPVARSIAEAMGGQITVESEPGRGSSFTVRLPVAEAVAA
jgi:signal transduction histidine kinase